MIWRTLTTIFDMNLELVAAENLRICGHEAQGKPKRDLAGETR